jgi:hypothetical protein
MKPWLTKGGVGQRQKSSLPALSPYIMLFFCGYESYPNQAGAATLFYLPLHPGDWITRLFRLELSRGFHQSFQYMPQISLSQILSNHYPPSSGPWSSGLWQNAGSRLRRNLLVQFSTFIFTLKMETLVTIYETEQHHNTGHHNLKFPVVKISNHNLRLIHWSSSVTLLSYSRRGNLYNWNNVIK